MRVNEYQKAAMATLNPALDKKDVAWYLAEAATALDVPLETVFQGNLDKLRQRFPNGFDVEASVHRKEGEL